MKNGLKTLVFSILGFAVANALEPQTGGSAAYRMGGVTATVLITALATAIIVGTSRKDWSWLGFGVLYFCVLIGVVVLPKLSKSRKARTSAPSAATQSVEQGRVLLDRKIGAYDPADPSKQLGHFTPGSNLEIVQPDAAPGMTLVRFTGPDGKSVTALCKNEDLGAGK